MDKVKILFEDMCYNTEYSVLEIGKDDDELLTIGKNYGVDLPSPDIAIFKGKYAITDQQNLNKCTLPRAEVEKALDTLKFKAIDVDHLRKKTIGTWLGAELEGNTIISYGAFWKSNYKEEYADFKDKMADGGIAISMEAWGTREYTSGNEYRLNNIHFAGGALLDDTSPACPGAEVIELSKAKERVLEFAKVITQEQLEKGNKKVIFSSNDAKVNDSKDHFPINDIDQARNALIRVAEYQTAPKWYNGSLSEVVAKVKDVVKTNFSNLEVSEDVLETSRFFFWDIEVIVRLLREVDCLGCGEKGIVIDMIDFANNMAGVTCLGEECHTHMMVQLTPMTTVMGSRKIKQISKYDSDDGAIHHFPNSKKIKIKNSNDHDSTQVKAGDNTDNVDTKTTKEVEQSMEKLLEKYNVKTAEELVQIIAKETIERELSEDELSFAFTVIEYKRGGGDANETSLMSLRGKSDASPTSLVGASEAEIKDGISDVAKITAKEAKDVEDAKAKETKEADEKVKAEKIELKAKEAKDAEDIDKAKELLETKDSEIAELKSKVDAYEKEQEETKAKAAATLIEARRNTLGEFGKKLSDEDILDDDKFVIAKQTKVISLLKEGKEVSSEDELELSKGSTDKDINSEATARQQVRNLAWEEDKK